MTTSPMRTLLDRCQALAAGMLGVAGLPPSTAKAIAGAADAVATAAQPDWAVYFSTSLTTLASGAIGHLALDEPLGLEDQLRDIRKAREALRPLVAPVLTEPGLLAQLREWQHDHGLTPVPRDEPSPLR